MPLANAGDNGGHTAGVVALAVGQSAAEGTLKDYMISASMDGTMGVFQVLDGAMTYKHKCGVGVTSLAVFDPTPGTSALLLVGYQVRAFVLVCICVLVSLAICLPVGVIESVSIVMSSSTLTIVMSLFHTY